ncbi:MAG: hypothetical protein JXM70_00725 [Pirellulales bacterium]|nr:hypothetical protein [Pirellulales bacterium]
MSVSKYIKITYRSYFSQPASDRVIFKAIRRLKAQRILECGIGNTQRARRIIETAQLVSPDVEINYTGIDLFEARTAADGPGVSLKLAHRQLSTTGAKIKLIPGNPLSAFTRAANSLGNTDLVIISARQNPSEMSAAWFYVPRILHANSILFEEQGHLGGQIQLISVSPQEIAKRAGENNRRRAA